MSDLITPEMPEPTNHRKKHHWLRWTFLSILGVIILLIIIGVTTSSGNNNNTNPQTNALTSNSPAPTPVDTFTPPEPSPTIQPANKIVFVISGNVPSSQFGGIDITYGSDSDEHNATISSLNGRLRYSVKFDSNAQYYSVDALYSSAGHISCKIVVIGPPPDAPLTVSHGSSTSGNSGGDCSAQAAPNNSDGTSWQNEQ